MCPDAAGRRSQISPSTQRSEKVRSTCARSSAASSLTRQMRRWGLAASKVNPSCVDELDAAFTNSQFTTRIKGFSELRTQLKTCHQSPLPDGRVDFRAWIPENIFRKYLSGGSARRARRAG